MKLRWQWLIVAGLLANMGLWMATIPGWLLGLVPGVVLGVAIAHALHMAWPYFAREATVDENDQ